MPMHGMRSAGADQGWGVAIYRIYSKDAASVALGKNRFRMKR